MEKGEKSRGKELYCFKVCCTSFSFQFLLVHSSWQSIEVGFVSKQVYDGKDGVAQLLGTYTGMSMQGLFLTSTSNCLWLEFSSDQDTTAAGFRLTYYSKSHFIAVVEMEDPKAFPNEWIYPRFRSQTLHVAGFKRKF